MKKNSKILALLLAVAFIAFCTVSTRESKVVQAFDTEASYITIKNSTAFTLENIHVTYNGDKELEYWKRNPITYRLSTGGRFFAV